MSYLLSMHHIISLTPDLHDLLLNASSINRRKMLEFFHLMLRIISI